MNLYRRNLEALVTPLLVARGPFFRALDFGSGDGWFAKIWREKDIARNIIATDVRSREECFVEPIPYDGRRLPFADRSFDLVCAIDVLHHCPEPEVMMAELLRCADDLVLIKDHTYASKLGWLLLCALDELGNRRFGVPSPNRYQRRWEWFPHIRRQGFELEQLVYPAVCETRPPLVWFSNRLQFVALWRRV